MIQNEFTILLKITRVRGMGSMLGSNRIIAKDVKSGTYCCYVRWGENALTTNRHNSVPMHS